MKINDKIKIIKNNTPTHDLPIGHKSKIFDIEKILYNGNKTNLYTIKIKFFTDLDHYYTVKVFEDEIEKLNDQTEILHCNDEFDIY